MSRDEAAEGSESEGNEPFEEFDHHECDPHGDLFLNVEEEGVQRRFLVCSRTLSRCSSFWRNKLRHSSNLEVSFETHHADPIALTTLFDIAHGNFSNIPTRLSLDNLHRIAVAVATYDMQRIIVPWASTWIQELNEIELFEIDAETANRCLRIAWVFGSSKHFYYLVQKLAYYGIEPNEFVNTFAIVVETRVTYLKSFVDIANAKVNTLLDSPNACECHQALCKEQMAGSVIRALRAAGLYPIPAESADKSPAQLFQMLNTMELIDTDCMGYWLRSMYWELIDARRTVAVETNEAMDICLRDAGRKTGCLVDNEDDAADVGDVDDEPTIYSRPNTPDTPTKPDDDNEDPNRGMLMTPMSTDTDFSIATHGEEEESDNDDDITRENSRAAEENMIEDAHSSAEDNDSEVLCVRQSKDQRGAQSASQKRKWKGRTGFVEDTDDEWDSDGLENRRKIRRSSKTQE
ncbi:hypothetical protein F5Y18DRAFT_430916 [Xylariaceae sp. FL1019]|nr:hypothetical protein F5Y18DRAFT_430916 [Xylariaceae sp. FL1019]